MHALYTLSVIVHVLAACTWIGAMVFFAAVVLPVLRAADYDAVRPRLIQGVGRRLRVLGWGSLGVLIATGCSNLALRGVGPSALCSPSFWRTEYGAALSFKLLFVGLTVVATAGHDVMATRSRRGSALLGRATLLFSMTVVAFAVWLVRGLP